MTKKILFFKNSEIDKILKLKIKDIYKAEILASICRLNTLSIQVLVRWIYLYGLNFLNLRP